MAGKADFIYRKRIKLSQSIIKLKECCVLSFMALLETSIKKSLFSVF
jgi:hypothetical protein